MVRFTTLLIALSLVAAPVTADAQGRARGRLGLVPPPHGRGYQEPAYTRGYSDGFRFAQDDRRDRRRYDLLAHREYQDGDQGFYREYGSRDAYKNNYRAGFRAGYDAGYRDENGRRR